MEFWEKWSKEKVIVIKTEDLEKLESIPVERIEKMDFSSL